MSKTFPPNNNSNNVTSRRTTRKKNNRHDPLDDAVDEYKDPDTIEPISVTNDPNPTDDDIPQTTTNAFQTKTNDRLEQLETSITGIADALTIIHEAIEDVRSRQNEPPQQTLDPTFDPNQPSSTTHTYDTNQSNVNTPNNQPTTQNHRTTPYFPTPNPPINIVPTPLNQTANHSHRYWKIAREDNFEPHCFQSFIKELTLQDDSLHSLRLFYNKIRHAMHTTFKKHTDILPNFDSLTNNINFADLLIPANDQYIGYKTIKSIYHWFSDSISNLLLDTQAINPKRAPKAHQIVITNRNINDGWKMLTLLLIKRCPFLGGKTLDVASEITLLRINSNDTIHTFYKRVQDIETKIIYSREMIDKTRLLKFYLKAMATSTDHFHLLQHFISDLNIHISTYGSNVKHPKHSCSSVYDYLTTIDAPEHFNIPYKPKHKNHKNSSYKNTKQGYNSGYSSSTISALEHLPDIMADDTIAASIDNIHQTSDDDSATSDSDDELHIDKYKPIISAFRRSSNIICDACGGRGHSAKKCFKRGRNFLPRDVQRRIAAYNAKYGESPPTDTSVTPDKAYHALPPPDHRPPSKNTPTTTDTETDTTSTISQLDHPTQMPTIEELLDQALGSRQEPSINTMHINTQDLPIMTNKSSLLHTIINNKGDVMPKYLSYYQETFLDKYTEERYTQHRQAIYHIDSGSNVHATNTRSDFIVFHPTKSTINLAVGSKAVCEGFGATLVQLTKTDPPIILAPVYFCPTAKVSTLSPGAIKVYNGYKDMNLRLLKALEYKKQPNSPLQTIPTTVYNNMDYIVLPVVHIKQNTHPTPPTISTIALQHDNNQFIHQKFDHRNIQMIINMKRNNLMDGIPTNVTKFHTNYNCPICKIANATKISTNKISDRPHMKPGEWFCFDYSFWNRKSIRGFTSLLTAVCLATRYSFVFPTRNKRPPIATIQWFIRTLRRQGYPTLYIQTDEGGKLGRSTDFLQALTDAECIYMGTGRSGSSFNGLVERPNRTIANSVRAKLLNAGLDDKFWCYAAEDANFKLRRMLHTATHVTPYQAWTGNKPKYSDMKIWGCHIYIVDTDVTRTKLDNRTYVELFMKFSATTKIIVYYNPKTEKFGRTSHAYFDELSTGTHTTLPTSPLGTDLVQNYPNLPTNIQMSDIQSDITKLPILLQPPVTFEVYLRTANRL